MTKIAISCALGALFAAAPALAEETVSFASYGGACQEAIRKAMLDPIAAEQGITIQEYSLTGGITEALRGEHRIGFTAYSTVMVWNKNVYKDTAPQGWADFFDTAKFLGSRVMSTVSPATNLEIALLADGADRAALYPLDVDRAYARLTALKPDIAVWRSTSAQATQLATAEEVDMRDRARPRV